MKLENFKSGFIIFLLFIILVACFQIGEQTQKITKLKNYNKAYQIELLGDGSTVIYQQNRIVSELKFGDDKVLDSIMIVDNE